MPLKVASSYLRAVFIRLSTQFKADDGTILCLRDNTRRRTAAAASWVSGGAF